MMFVAVLDGIRYRIDSLISKHVKGLSYLQDLFENCFGTVDIDIVRVKSYL